MSDQTGTVTLNDGAEIAYRPIAAEDAPALQRFHDRLSQRSVYQRFFGVVPHLSDAQAHYFTQLDGVDRVALVALDPGETGEIIAVVRFDREQGTEQAEYAAVVADRWQGKGLGTALSRRLIAVARAHGIRRLFAIVLPTNAGMLHLLRDLGLPEAITFVDGVERVELML